MSTTDYTNAQDIQDRGDFSDKTPARSPAQKGLILLIGLIALGLMIYFALKLSGLIGKEPVKQEIKVEEPVRPDSTPNFSVSLAEPTPPPQNFVVCEGGLRLPEGMTCPPSAKPAEPTPQQAAAKPAAPEKTGPTEAEIVRQRRLNSEVNISSGNAATKPAAIQAAAGAQPAELNGATALGAALKGTATARTLARNMPNPSLTLVKGTLPDCTLMTAVSTDQPGFLKCILSRPVYSMDGKVILLEAGTTFEGEYQSGMARGKKRMFAVWTRGITPNHVVIDLNSPTTDSLGRSGMTGKIDNHFFERFGGAMLYSLFSDYTDYLVKQSTNRSQERRAALQSTTGSSVNIGMGLGEFDRTRSTGEMIVEQILNQGEDIQPSLEKNQGEIIKIFVARDIDFSQVYALEPNSKE